MNLSELKESIKAGLIKGYRQNVLLLSAHTGFIDNVREYLLTVNIAQQLIEGCSPADKIHIEYPASLFYENAFDRLKVEGDMFSSSIIKRRENHFKGNRSHDKIDLAITKGVQESSYFTEDRVLVGIEVKGINKSKKNIKNDAIRLSDAMITTDVVSSNSIKFGICCFLMRLDKEKEMITNNIISERTDKVKSKWEKVCADLGRKYSQLNFFAELFPIEVPSLETIACYYDGENSDYSEVASNTGIVIGCLLIIEKKV